MRLASMVWSALLLVAVAACGGLEEEEIGLEQEGTGREAQAVFPGTDWVQATPASQGVDPTKLQAAINYLKANAPFDGVNEVVVIRNGYMIWKGSNIDKRHGIWSATKSFTSTVLGLLIDDGKTTLDTKVATRLSSMSARYPNVTFRHFATMTSGYFAAGDTTSSHSASRTPFTPSTPLFAPGTKFAYWDSAMNQFANGLTRVAGEPIEQLFKRRIADPIGMKATDWDWGDWGSVDGLVVNGGAGNAARHIFITARQLARLGLLFLNRGRWNGKQLISSSWVDAATRAQVPSGLPQGSPVPSPSSGSGVYGFNWWTNNGQRMWPGVPASAYSAAGYNNNKMMIVPEWNLVVVRMGLDGGAFGIKNSTYASFLQKIGAAITTTTTQPSTPTELDCLAGRIAVSADGNQHDQDDWGATPATLALLARKNLQSKLVHYDYSNHLGDNLAANASQMTTSALGGAQRFGFDTARFFDDQTRLAAAVDNLRVQINASSASNPLCILAMGPMEVLWRGVNASDPARRRYVKVFSHSSWNDSHRDTTQMTHTKSSVVALGVNWVGIIDQNAGLQTDYASFHWMRDAADARLRWVYDRMVAVGKADISDSGLAYYLITGDQNGTATKYRTFFGSWVGSSSGGSTVPMAITGFTLVNSTTDTDLRALSSGGLIRLAQDGSKLNIRANVSGSPGSVKLALAGSAPRLENVAPYALAGDTLGNYADWTPGLGMHTLTATPYSLANGQGVAGTPLTITFTVTSN